MPTNSEHVKSPWPEDIPVEEIGRLLKEGRMKRESLKQPAKQEECTVSLACEASYHSHGCPVLKSK